MVYRGIITLYKASVASWLVDEKADILEKNRQELELAVIKAEMKT